MLARMQRQEESMARYVVLVFGAVILFSTITWASVSMEELQAQKNKLIERELKRTEARQERMVEAAQALQDKEYNKAIDLASEVIYDYQLKDAAKAEVLALRGVAYLLKEDLNNARKDAEEALRENKQEARAYLILSHVHEKKQNSDKAVADMEAYLRLKPSDRAGLDRLTQLKGKTAAAPITDSQQPSTTAAQPVPAPTPTKQHPPSVAAEPTPQLKLFVSQHKRFALHKPADWTVEEDSRQDSYRVILLSPDKASAVDFLWVRNQGGEVNALRALAAYEERLVPPGGKIEWRDAFLSPDKTRATVAMRFRSSPLALDGRFYMEATEKALSLQGYMTREGYMERNHELLYNIMASFVFSRQPVAQQKSAKPFVPQYVKMPLVRRAAPDGSMTMSTPADWTFVAAQGKVVTGAVDGSRGFAFLAFDGNPILQGATVAQSVIARPYMPPLQAIQTILAGFGHRDIRITSHQPDPRSVQEFIQNVRRGAVAEDVTATWTSSSGATCMGFFKVINAAPSPTGLWFSILAGLWGPQNEFYLHFPLLEQVASSYVINDQFARRYIEDGLKRARELHDKTVAAMRDNAQQREKQQAEWEAKQKQQDFANSKWDDYWRGNTYWVSDLENGKVYQADNYGLEDKVNGTYYEGKGYSYTHFGGQNPRHPSETMREVTRHELEQTLGQ